MDAKWVIAALTMLVGCDAATPASPTSTVGGAGVVANATVVHVVDGDTIDVEIGGREERVRLVGIDTPETKRPDHPVECFGPEATAFTESLLPPGTSVRLERDIVGRDHFGRLLGYVYRAEDGVFVNEAIVRGGFAQPMTIPPNDLYAERFAEAALAAERADLGLWAACSR